MNMVVCMTYKMGSGLDDWIFWHLIHTHNSGLQVIQCYCYSTHFIIHRCTHTRVLSLHWSYPGNGFTTVSLSSFHSLISFLPLFCNCQLNSIPSSYPGRLTSQTQLYSSRLDCSILGPVFWLCPFITPRYGPHGKYSMYCWQGLFTALLPSNRRPSVAHVGLRRNVFTESLPNNGYTHHNTIKKIFQHLISSYSQLVNFQLIELSGPSSARYRSFYCIQASY
jgi:hypothetical protein